MEDGERGANGRDVPCHAMEARGRDAESATHLFHQTVDDTVLAQMRRQTTVTKKNAQVMLIK